MVAFAPRSSLLNGNSARVPNIHVWHLAQYLEFSDMHAFAAFLKTPGACIICPANAPPGSLWQRTNTPCVVECGHALLKPLRVRLLGKAGPFKYTMQIPKSQACTPIIGPDTVAVHFQGPRCKRQITRFISMRNQTNGRCRAPVVC